MSRHLRAAVIGGGVTGCNILYHLVKAGWRDVALFERKELTAGATWHSSGHIAHFTRSPQLTGLALETRAMLQRIEEETGQPLGVLHTGSLRLATHKAALDDFAAFAETVAGVACGARMVSAREAGEMWPLAKLEDVEGALFIPADCRLNAADFTQALAAAARAGGATIHRETEVTALSPRPGGGWALHTDKGEWTVEHVITASGIFARRTLPALGIKLPVSVVSHQYLVTESVPEIADRRAKKVVPLPILRQPDIGLNIREEGEGYCISLYEQNASAVFRDGPPSDFGMDLFPEDFESIEAGFEGAMARVPSLGEAGIRSTVHGPMPWSPDFAPIAGPVPGLRNLWVAEAMSYGVTWSGGIAKRLVDWITTGDPGDDMSSFDPRRFGGYATSEWADAQAIATYKGVYGSGEKTCQPEQTAVHDLLVARGAEFEEIDGRAVASRIPADGAVLANGAIHVPAVPTILHVDGEKATDFLASQLQGPLPTSRLEETHGWLLSQTGHVASRLRVRLAGVPDRYEIDIEAKHPGVVRDELEKRAGGLEGVSVSVVEPKLSALIFVGPRKAFEPIGMVVPERQGGLAAFSIGNKPVRSVREPDLNGLPRWRILCEEAELRSVLEACLAESPTQLLLGTHDYADLQIAAGEPVCGREITSNMTPDGHQVRGLACCERGTLRLAAVQIEVDGEIPRVNTILRGPDGAVLGRLVSVSQGRQSVAAFAMIRTDALEQRWPLSLRIGATDCAVSVERQEGWPWSLAPLPAEARSDPQSID